MNYITEQNRIYLENEAGETLAEVTFPDTAKRLVDINHTYVDDSLRGQGIAGELMTRAAAHIRQSGKKAQPTCSYAMRWFAKHPEYSDILHR